MKAFPIAKARPLVASSGYISSSKVMAAALNEKMNVKNPMDEKMATDENYTMIFYIVQKWLGVKFK